MELKITLRHLAVTGSTPPPGANRLQIVLGIRKILRVVLEATINANNYSTLVLGRKFMEYTSLPNLISFVSFLVY